MKVYLLIRQSFVGRSVSYNIIAGYQFREEAVAERDRMNKVVADTDNPPVYYIDSYPYFPKGVTSKTPVDLHPI